MELVAPGASSEASQRTDIHDAFAFEFVRKLEASRTSNSLFFGRLLSKDGQVGGEDVRDQLDGSMDLELILRDVNHAVEGKNKGHGQSAARLGH